MLLQSIALETFNQTVTTKPTTTIKTTKTQETDVRRIDVVVRRIDVVWK